MSIVATAVALSIRALDTYLHTVSPPRNNYVRAHDSPHGYWCGQTRSDTARPPAGFSLFTVARSILRSSVLVYTVVYRGGIHMRAPGGTNLAEPWPRKHAAHGPTCTLEDPER